MTSITRWHEFKEDFTAGCMDIYTLPGYYKLYEDIGDGRAFVFYCEQDGKIAYYPFLINSVNELGYNLDQDYYDIQGAYGYNGVISNSYEPSFIDFFYQKFNEYCNKNNIIAEFTRFNPLLSNEKFSGNHLEVIYNRDTIVIDLTKSYNEIWINDYTRKNRQRVRKADLMGCKIVILEDPDYNDINVFRNLYEFTLHRVNAHSYYFFKPEYFFNIFKSLKGKAYLFNVINPDGEVVCSCIFLHCCDNFLYHLMGKSQNCEYYVNSFLIDQAVVFAKRAGLKFLHLGGGRTNNEDDSLLRFKREFSKKSLPFYIGKKIYNKAVYDEVVKQWSEKYPEKVMLFSDKILKYRY